jgi:hypothetical protein
LFKNSSWRVVYPIFTWITVISIHLNHNPHYIYCLLLMVYCTWQEQIKQSFHTTFQIISPILAANSSIMSKYNTNFIQKFLILISRVVLSAFLTSLFISLVFIRTDLLCQYYSRSLLSDDKVHSVYYFGLRWSTAPPWRSREVYYFGPLVWHWARLAE